MKILKDLAVSGQISVGQLLQSSIDTDKFLVAENGVVKFRTGSEILSDIGGISGNQTITLSGDVSGSGTTSIALTVNRLTYQGNYANGDVGTTRGPDGLSLRGVYANGYPTTYGNILHMKGWGAGQLLIGWSGTDGNHADNYVRSKRDNDSGAWSSWAKIWTDANLTNLNQLTNGPGYITGNQTITISGDASGSGTTAITVTLANSGVTAGTYNNVTVDAKGRVTAGSNVSYVPTSRTLTINGTAYDLSADRSWTIVANETDTLATVTGRGASTATNVTLSGTGNQFSGHHYFLPWDSDGNHYPHYNIGGNNNGSKLNLRMFGGNGSITRVFYLNGNTGAISWDGNTIWHAGNLTNLNQLANGPGYITSYTETDTLATVTARGATTTGAITVNGRTSVGEDLFLTRTNNDFGYITRPNTSGYKKVGFLVNGGGNLTDFYVYSDVSYFNGDVGIGTTPAHGLHVNRNQNQVAAFQSPNANTWVDIISTTRTWSMGSTSSSTWAIYDRGTNTTRMEIDTGSNLYAYGSMRAPIFYDSSNSAYYLDPNNTDKSLSIAGNIDLIARSSSWAEGIRIRVPSTSTWGGIRFTRDRPTDDGNWAIGFTGIDSSDDLTFWANNGGDGGSMKLRINKSGQLSMMAADQDLRINRGRFQVYNNAGTGNLGYRIRTDENGGWRWQFVDGGNTEYFGVAYSTGVLTLRPSSGTMIERGGFSDFIGYNPSYGSYIGGGVSNASNYLYAGGYFYDGSTIRTLLHSGNYNSYSPTLTGGGASGTWGISITGNSNYSSYTGRVNIPDWRDTSYTPNQYTGNSVGWHFNNVNSNNGPAGDFWGAMMTVAPWSEFNTSHRQSQIWFGGSVGLSYRYAEGSGYTPSGWSSWQRIMTSANSPYGWDMNQYVRTSDTVTFNEIRTTTGYLKSNNPIYNLTLTGSAQNVWGKRILLSEDYYGNDGLIPYGSGLDKNTVWVHDFTASRKHGIVVSADNNGEAHFYAVDFANSTGSSTIGGSAGGWGFNLYYDGVSSDPFNLRIGQAGTWTHALKISFARDVQWQNLNSFTINGNAALHAGNYSSYALPLGGGTVTGATNFDAGNGGGGSQSTAVALRVRGFGNYDSLEFGIENNYAGVIRSYGNDIRYYSGHWRSVGTAATEEHSNFCYTSRNGSTDWSVNKMNLNHQGHLTVANGNYAGITINRDLGTNDYANSGQHNMQLRIRKLSADSGCAPRTLELGVLDNGTGIIQANHCGIGYNTISLNPVAGAVLINGATALHSSNYNSYSPTLTGGNASGTWAINITGSSSQASNSDTVDGYHADAFFKRGSWDGHYHYGLSYSSTSTGTRWRVARVYYSSCHWGSYGVMKLRARSTYYNGGYIEWTISNNPGSAQIKTTDHSLTQTGQFNCFLGGAVQQGDHSGCATFYRDIFIEVGPYIGVNIDFTWNATLSFDGGDGGGSSYSTFVIYTGGNRTQTNQGISSPIVEYRAPRITADVLAVNTTDPATNGLVADFNGSIGVRGANTLYFGHSNNNYNSWSTKIYASGSTMIHGAQSHVFGNEGYGSTFSTTINSSGVTTSSVYISGSIVNNNDGAVMMESNASENNNWLWKENAKQWGIFWFNRGTQSGQTIGTYTTVGAEVMYMGGGSGIGMPSGWTGYTAGSNIAAMISNYNGYIYAHGTIFANGRFETRDGLYFERGSNSFTTFIRSSNHPDQGYTGSADKYWVELGSYGGTHVVLNMDGSKNDGQNNFDHFTIWQSASNSTSGSRQFYVTNIGNVWARNDITAFSDARVKENIRPIENALYKVLNSRGVMYDRIDTGEKNGIGFIAQELELEIPDLVKTDDRGMKSVKYQNMVAVLTEAVKEQQKQIEELKNKLDAFTK